MTASIVLVHGGESTGRKLLAAVPGAAVSVVYLGKGSSKYDDHSGLAFDLNFPAFLVHYAPAWKPGDPLAVLAFSAGGWALRAYLRNPDAQQAITCAVFLDSTYSGGETDGYEGVIEYGALANAEPAKHRLVMTYSHAHPGPERGARAIARAVGPGPGVVVLGTEGSHGDQQGVVGPFVARTIIAPMFGLRPGVAPKPAGSRDAGWLLALLAFYFLGR